jgi:hypothetical protein
LFFLFCTKKQIKHFSNSQFSCIFQIVELNNNRLFRKYVFVFCRYFHMFVNLRISPATAVKHIFFFWKFKLFKQRIFLFEISVLKNSSDTSSSFPNLNLSLLYFFSSGIVTFPEVTVCAAYEISYKFEVLDKHKIPIEHFRRNFKYPNVSNLTGTCKALHDIFPSF